MTTRTFKQCGCGYGGTTVNITVKLNGTVIYQGPVLTKNEPVGVPAAITNNTLFSWNAPVEFNGVFDLEIAVTGGRLVIESTFGNYVFVPYDQPGPSMISGGPDTYGWIYISSGPSGITSDPLTDVSIDNIPHVKGDTSLTAQWTYTVESGSTWRARVHVQPGADLDYWNSNRSYPEHHVVLSPQNSLYIASQAVPANTPLSTMAYWRPLPLLAWDEWRNWAEGDMVEHNNKLYRAKMAVPARVQLNNATYWDDYADPEEVPGYLESLNPN